MINVFYNLKRLPFQKEISHQDIFRADSANELLRRLEHMKQQRGIMLIQQFSVNLIYMEIPRV